MIEQLAFVACAGFAPLLALAVGFGTARATARPAAAPQAVAILPAVDVALIQVASNGRIRSVNDVAPLMFGMDRDSLVGRPIDALLPALREVESAGRARWLTGSRGAILGTALETDAVHSDGLPFPVEVVIAHDSGGRVLALRDTGREQQVFAAARRATAEAAAVRHAAGEGQRARSRFLANMNHELRTPLNAILGYSEMLREDLQEQGMQRYVVDIDRVIGAGKRLLSQIEDVLELTRLESGEDYLCAETFEVSSLVEELADELSASVTAQRDVLVVDVPDDLGSARTDAVKVAAVLRHLLANAIRFTHAGRIQLSARGDGDLLEFRVADDGTSIPEPDRLITFDPFADVDRTTRRLVGGARVGLALAHGFAKLLGGTLVLGPPRERGTEFVFRIPRTARETAHETAHEAAPAEAPAPPVPVEAHVTTASPAPVQALPTLVPPEAPEANRASPPAGPRTRRSLLARSPTPTPVTVPAELAVTVTVVTDVATLQVAEPRTRSRRLLGRKDTLPVPATTPANRGEKPCVLVVDTDAATCVSFAQEFDRLGCRVFIVTSPDQVVATALACNPAVVALHASSLGQATAIVLDQLCNERSLSAVAVTLLAQDDDGTALGTSADRLVRLPIDHAAMAALKPTGGRGRALLVQEPGEARDVLVGLFERCGLRVDLADDYSDALDLVDEAPPVIVIADLTTPNEVAIRLAGPLHDRGHAVRVVWALPRDLSDGERAELGGRLANATRLAARRLAAALPGLGERAGT